MVSRRLTLILNLSESLAFLLGKGLHLRFRIELLAGELLGPFQRRHGIVGPYSLQVRLAIGRTRRCPRLPAGGCGLCGRRLCGGRRGLSRGGGPRKPRHGGHWWPSGCWNEEREGSWELPLRSRYLG